VPNSFIATTAAICHVGAIPTFVDVGEDQNMNVDLIESAISSKTAAILPVHLTGRMADMKRIMDIANKYGLTVIEDAAQAIGSSQAGRLSGTWGNVGCFSTHPLKNLNAIGDGGFLATNEDAIAAYAKKVRSHGLADRNTCESFGVVARLDAVKAAILSWRLKNLGKVIEARRAVARDYSECFVSSAAMVPPESYDRYDTYHTYVIQTPARDRVMKDLSKRGIETRVHYPSLIVDQPALQSKTHVIMGNLVNAYSQAQHILSLPIRHTLTSDETSWVMSQFQDAVARVAAT
jgi:dTDP-4-amino-4,6-dideoxygalactose transaminase